MTTIKLPNMTARTTPHTNGETNGTQPRQRVTPAQRHTRRHPCPICGGGHDDPRGRGMRCSGYTSANRRYAYCSREEFAGALPPPRDGRHYPHRLDAPCRCGDAHDRLDHRAPHDDPGHSRDLRPPRQFACHGDLPTRAGVGFILTHAYPYHTATGAIAYEVRRFERPSPLGADCQPDKLFRQYTPRPDGSWIEALDAPRVLYHLPDILAAPASEISAISAPVYLCEGEKAADALGAALAADVLPGVATTTVGGASAGHLTPLEALRGRRVVILPDHDTAGRRYAEVMAAGARTAGALAVATLELAGLPEKGDVVEWLAAGHSAAELLLLAEERLAVTNLVTSLATSPVAQAAASAASAASDASDAISAQADLQRFEPLGTLLSAVEPEAVRWFWRGYIPLGKVTTLDGDPGLGKSTLTAYLAACATRGLPLPDGSRCAPGGVVLLSAEDDAADTIRPRLDAAEADPERVYLLQGIALRDSEGKAQERDVYLPGDLPALEAAIQRMDARLVVIDPLMAFLSGEVNSHRDQDVRGALRPLTALASQSGAAIVLVRHLNKSAGGNALYRGGGSIGIIAAARSGLLVAPDPDDPEAGTANGRRVLAVVKSNQGAAVPALTFRVVSAPSGVGMIAWEGESRRTANDLMSQPLGEEERSQRDEAVEYLRSALAEGPRKANEVRAEAPRELQKALWRAGNQLHVERTRVGFGKGSYVEWSLPSSPDASPRDTARDVAPVSSSIDCMRAIDCIDSSQQSMQSMQSMQPMRSMANAELRAGHADDAGDVCAVTGGKHVTALLRTADGWLRCIECEQTLPIRAS